MTVDITSPGAAAVQLQGAIASLLLRANIDWVDGSNSDFSGTIDTTGFPYLGASSEGQSVLCASPNSVNDSGIWVLGSHTDPAAVPVTRREDSEAGAVFRTDEKIIVAGDANVYATASVLNGDYEPVAQGTVGTDYVIFYTHAASGEGAIAIGNGSTASGNGSVAIGSNSIASGAGAVALGTQSTASGGVSVANGLTSKAYLYGMEAWAVGQFSQLGDAQREVVVCRKSTANDTPANLLVDGFAALYVLPNNSSLAFTGHVIAREAATGDSAGFKFDGVITRGAGVETTALVAAITPDAIAASAGASAWDVAVTADIVNGSLNVTVTGETGKTIRWVGKIDGVKVI